MAGEPTAVAGPRPAAATRSSSRYATYVGRVGALAVALGVGLGVATALTIGVARADTETGSSEPSSDSQSQSPGNSDTSTPKTDDNDTRDAKDNKDESQEDGPDTAQDVQDDADDSATEADAVGDSATPADDTHRGAAIEKDQPVSSVDTESASAPGPEPVAVQATAAIDITPKSDSRMATPKRAPRPPSPTLTFAATAPLATREVERALSTAATPATNAEIVTGLYREMLREDPTAQELQRYTNLLSWAGIRAVVSSLYRSTDFRQLQVQSYYNELLGRDPSQNELSRTTFRLKIGAPEQRIVSSIAGSSEFFVESGGTADDFVRLMYRSMLGQVADPNILPVYVQRLQAGRSQEAVARQFATSDTYRQVKVQETFLVVLGRAATADETAKYIDRWFVNGGQAGIAKSLLASTENVDRMTSGGVPLPDMLAIEQLAEILKAPYDEQATGFVRLFNTLMETAPLLPCTSDPCNVPLWDLIKVGGAERGIPNQSIQVLPSTVNVGTLIPTQNEIGVDNSLRFPLTDPVTLEKYLRGGTVLANTVILTADFGTYIVDGHHRWSALYVCNPYAQISTVDLGYVPDPQEALKETQIAIGAQTGELPAQNTQGSNLLTVDRAQFDADVVRLINSGDDPQAVLDVFKDVQGLDDIAEIQQFLWNNVLRMREFNQPVAGATNRGFMPQPPDLQTLLHLMESGDLSYSFPIIAVLG